MKYGVYTYSMYENASEARTEAKSLYNRAPNASFISMIMRKNQLLQEIQMQVHSLG